MSQPTDTPPRQEDYVRFKHYTAMTFLVISPILIALPPRKLDLYTASLGTAFIISASHLTTQRTGQGLVSHMGSFIERHKPTIFRDLPTEQAEEVQIQLRIAREKERELAEKSGNAASSKEGEEGVGLRGLGKKVWMGGESEGWKERRWEEERKALEEGRGYGDLIMEYLKDAWRLEKKGEEQTGQRNTENDPKN